ncbi:MAG: polysaccharide deacetylase family protein [Pseudomonadota bacterium]|nr:polysaccharide deacetylase family protein [Pseudomonadota bacterium]
MDRLLGALRRVGIPLLGLGDLLANPASPGVALTFDDGMRTVMTDALPVLRHHDTPAHLFLTTGAVGGNNRWPSQPVGAPTFAMLNWTEIETLHRAGIHIEGHTVQHPDLRQLSDLQLLDECDGADRVITERFGRAPQFFAYPYGYHDQRVRQLLGPRYRACLTTDVRMLRPGDGMSGLPRLESYYLRPEWLARHPSGALSRHYLALRAVLRRLRSWA